MHLSMKVCIFSTCIVDLLFPNVGQAMVEVLERFGCETVFPKGRSVAVNQRIIAVTVKKRSRHFTMRSMLY